jgi:hypothetical protein
MVEIGDMTLMCRARRPCLSKLPGPWNLRSLLSGFEREAAAVGAKTLVIEGRLASAIFSSKRAAALAEKLGYSFSTLADGTVVLVKSVVK